MSLETRLLSLVSAIGADVKILLSRSDRNKVYTSSTGLIPGYDWSTTMNYDTDETSLPEPWLVSVKNTVSEIRRSFWLNESGIPRINIVRKSEAGLRIHSFAQNHAGAVFEIRDNWYQGATRRFTIDGRGQFLLGPSQTKAGSVVVLGPTDPVPTDDPPTTVYFRRPA